jgi:threonine/homoserine/homoserine lactone efflux protein
MSLDRFLALLVFALVASLTPGPNNVMLMASGANFGFRRTVPHMVGVSAGFLVLDLAVGFGLGAAVAAVPGLSTGLKWFSAGYLLWLAWTIARTRSMDERTGTARPMTITEAALFQLVNPKGWTMALVAMGAYTDPAEPVRSVLLVVAAFAAATVPSVLLWSAFGVALRGWLARPGRLRAFNIAMGILLALTAVPILL